MSRLNIIGEVYYLDGTPAAGASVSIVEIDALHGGRNDKILNTTTDVDGRFLGRSTEWKDREGVVLGIDVPDVLQLTFTVKVDGRTHTGPFIHFGRESAPIILPIPPPKPVSKGDRELVQIILVSQGTVGAERTLYEFIETVAETLTTTVLGPSYDKVTFLKGLDATLTNFVDSLRLAAGRVKAVDVIFTTHGDTDLMVFADEDQPEAKVLAALTALPDETRAKFRAIFSTACFGRTHLDTWIGAGFKQASGSEGIYADSAVSYAPFLAAWAAEKTFAEAVALANAADVNNVADNLARAFYISENRRADAAQVNSDRKVAGNGRGRIYSKP